MAYVRPRSFNAASISDLRHDIGSPCSSLPGPNCNPGESICTSARAGAQWTFVVQKAISDYLVCEPGRHLSRFMELRSCINQRPGPGQELFDSLRCLERPMAFSRYVSSMSLHIADYVNMPHSAKASP